LTNISLVDQHCCNVDGSTRPLLLVTASVDRIVLKKPILVDADLTIVGAVTWVGRSSMEIQMEVIQPTEGTLVINGVSFVLSSTISAVI
jgi:acyl-coenzyme A thioesterase 9